MYPNTKRRILNYDTSQQKQLNDLAGKQGPHRSYKGAIKRVTGVGRNTRQGIEITQNF